MKVASRTALWLAIAAALAGSNLPVRAQQNPGPPAVQQRPVPAFPTVPADVPTTPAAATPVAPQGRTVVPVARLPELSPWSMFLSADAVVKVVIVSLLVASFVTWTLFLAKTVQLFRARWELTATLGRIDESRTLREARLTLRSRSSVLHSLFSAALEEIRLSTDHPVESGIKERAASRFAEIRRLEAKAVRFGVGPIATIGATAPFVGLFGTVWGIMNSFIGISKAQTANLAVVAPGIAEALLATAAGLAAAIPAVIIYNHFTRTTRSYLDIVGRSAETVGRLLSRDLDRLRRGIGPSAAE